MEGFLQIFIMAVLGTLFIPIKTTQLISKWQKKNFQSVWVLRYAPSLSFSVCVPVLDFV
jgi:hypothetical protein